MTWSAWEWSNNGSGTSSYTTTNPTNSDDSRLYGTGDVRCQYTKAIIYEVAV